MNVRLLLAELKRRRVYRVAAIYSAGAWALLQVADILFPLMGLPDSTISMVLVAAAVGFVPALVLAWMFDLTPEGVVEAPPVQFSRERLTLTTTRIAEFALIVLLIVSVGLLYIDRLTLQEQVNSSTELPPIGETTLQRESIAVLPFTNMSSEPELEYFGDGLAEEILNLLAKLNELNVSARTSSFYFKNKDVDIQEIGQRLGVSHVLEGSVRRQGDSIRVTAQLIATSNGFHLWSETYDKTLGNILSLQDDIASDVVDTLQVLLSNTSRDILKRKTTVDPEAYDNYLQGRAYLRRTLDDANINGAIEKFTRASELAPDFAEGFAGLCDALLLKYDRTRAGEHFEAAEKSCHRALTLDGQAIAVYVALGNLYLQSGQYTRAELEFDRALAIRPRAVDAYLGLAEVYFEENRISMAEQAYQRVIDIQPNDARGYMHMGIYLYGVGRLEEAIPYYKKAAELMPDSPGAFNNIGVAYYMLGQFEQANAAWQDSLRLQPSAVVFANTASSFFFLERFDEAVEMYHKALELVPEDAQMWGDLADAYRFSSEGVELSLPMFERAIELSLQQLRINSADADVLAMLGHYYAQTGNRALALANLDKSIGLAPQDMFVYYRAATAYCALGELEPALENLEKAIEYGYPWQLASVDMGLKELRKMPRFEALSIREE